MSLKKISGAGNIGTSVTNAASNYQAPSMLMGGVDQLTMFNYLNRKTN